MHDLSTIQRLNTEAVQRECNSLRQLGPVVAVYHGLHFSHGLAAGNPAEAELVAARVKAEFGAGTRTEILPKLTSAELAVARGRDQSEDRAPAALVAVAPMGAVPRGWGLIEA